MILFSHFFVISGQLLRVLTGVALALTLCTTAFAEVISVEIPSEQRSSDAEQEAISSGLKQVLVQMTGDPEIVSNEELLKELGDPEAYLSSYWDKPATEDEPPTGWIYVVEFEVDGIRPFLEGYIKDPSVDDGVVDEQQGEGVSSTAVIWMLIEPDNTAGFILGTEASLAGDWAEKATHSAIINGFELLLPLMDVQDLSTVTQNNILEADGEALNLAAARYPVSATLVAVATQDAGSNWFVRVHKAGNQGDEVYGDSDTFESAVSLAFGDLDMQNGSVPRTDVSVVSPVNPVVPTGVAELPAVESITEQVDYVDVSNGNTRIEVSGVKGYSDYRKIIQYLSADPRVVAVLPKGSGSGSAKFELQFNGNSSDWFATISQDSEAVLQPTAMPENKDLSHTQYYFILR